MWHFEASRLGQQKKEVNMLVEQCIKGITLAFCGVYSTLYHNNLLESHCISLGEPLHITQRSRLQRRVRLSGRLRRGL